MTVYLKQSTASQEVPLGHFVDDTDGKTAETALTIANTDIKLWKTGATTLANKNSGGATHISGGIYYCVLDATDTDTVGPLVIFVAVAGALAVRLECDVLPANVYDSRYGAAFLDVNIEAINTSTTAANNAGAYFDGTGYKDPDNFYIIRSGTAQAGSGTTITLDASASATDDLYNGAMIQIISGTGAGQARMISDYVGSTKVATVPTNWATNPSSSSVFIIWPSIQIESTASLLAQMFTLDTGQTYAGAVAGSVVKEIADNAIGGGLDAAGVRGALGMASANLDTQLSTIDTVVDGIVTDVAAVKSDTAAILDDTGTSGVLVGSIAANAITATAIANDAITDAKVAADVTIASVTGSVGSVTGAVGSVTGAVGSVTGAVGSVTGDVGGNVTGSIGSLAAQAKADVNAEVLDVMATDTITLSSQGAPTATPTIKGAIGQLYKNFRNKQTVGDGEVIIYADDGTTADHKATYTDDGTTGTRGKWGTGA